MSAVRHQIVNESTIAIDEDVRLDARYWQQGFRAAQRRVYESGYEVRPLGAVARVWFPPRFKRVYATDIDAGMPFLRAHSTFYTIPQSDRILSSSRTRGFEAYLVERGWLLLACSGTLGAVAYVTDHLSSFAITHDLVRIAPGSEHDSLYLAAYLQTDIGRLLATHDEHGSAVPHISDKQAARIPVPVVDAPLRKSIVGLMRQSLAQREESTTTLKELGASFLSACGLPDPVDFRPRHLDGGVRAWALTSREVSAARIDAEFFSPGHRLARELVARSEEHAALADVAELHLPNRYRRIYVDPEYGTPQSAAGISTSGVRSGCSTSPTCRSRIRTPTPFGPG